MMYKGGGHEPRARAYGDVRRFKENNQVLLGRALEAACPTRRHDGARHRLLLVHVIAWINELGQHPIHSGRPDRRAVDDRWTLHPHPALDLRELSRRPSELHLGREGLGDRQLGQRAGHEVLAPVVRVLGELCERATHREPPFFNFIEFLIHL